MMLKRNGQMSSLQKCFDCKVLRAGKQRLLLFYQIVQNRRALSSTKPNQPHLGPPPTPVNLGALFKLSLGPLLFHLSNVEGVLLLGLEVS